MIDTLLALLATLLGPILLVYIALVVVVFCLRAQYMNSSIAVIKECNYSSFHDLFREGKNYSLHIITMVSPFRFIAFPPSQAQAQLPFKFDL